MDSAGFPKCVSFASSVWLVRWKYCHSIKYLGITLYYTIMNAWIVSYRYLIFSNEQKLVMASVDD